MKHLWLGLWMLWGLMVSAAWAHKPSDSYVTLTAHDGGVVDVSWHVALRDLDGELNLDANDDGRLTWGEVRTRWQDLLHYVRPHLRLSHAAQSCERVADSDQHPAVIEHTDGQYAVFAWRMQCPLTPGQPWSDMDVDYRLFALTDPTHRGIVRLRTQGGADTSAHETTSVVLGVDRPQYHAMWTGLAGQPVMQPVVKPIAPAASEQMPQTITSALPQPPTPIPHIDTRASQVLRFVHDGVEHIASGMDHILFLVSLLLVSVWRRGEQPIWSSALAGWQARAQWRSAISEVLRLVTAFTLAHSLTLALASFGLVSPPSRWVESLIALSVLVAALDNIWPILRAPRWIVVFCFGLVHGFGFAGAMQDLGLARQDLAWPLLGFNLGVELGQLLLVAAVLPVAFWLRRTTVYRHAVVLPGSLAIALLAALWLYERTADVSLGWLPG